MNSYILFSLIATLVVSVPVELPAIDDRLDSLMVFIEGTYRPNYHDATTYCANSKSLPDEGGKRVVDYNENDLDDFVFPEEDAEEEVQGVFEHIMSLNPVTQNARLRILIMERFSWNDSPYLLLHSVFLDRIVQKTKELIQHFEIAGKDAESVKNQNIYEAMIALENLRQVLKDYVTNMHHPPDVKTKIQSLADNAISRLTVAHLSTETATYKESTLYKYFALVHRLSLIAINKLTRDN
ncbi:hypothetical protein OXX79_006684 [Metschnikowia pulcherrima]